MAHPGEQVSNPISGETVTFRRTSDGAAAGSVEFDLELRPVGAPGGMPHRHLPAETFEVTSGKLHAFVGGQGKVSAVPGEKIEVPPNRWHLIFALRRSSARVTIEPGMHFDDLIACGAAIGSGEVRPATLRQISRLLREHDCFPRVP